MPKQPKPSTKKPSPSRKSQPEALETVDIGQLSGVAGGCGHRRQQQHQQQDPRYGYPPPGYYYPPQWMGYPGFGGYGGYGGYGQPYGNGGPEVTTNVDVGQQGQSIIRR
jgi:hypothetical protein